jgi:hypothetical protein
MSTQPLPLSIIANLSVIVNSPQVAAPTFNTGLVVGTSTAIPSYGTNPRIRKYLQATFSTAMVTDGFSTASAEYICAQIYFSQSPPPQAIYIGRQDLTAIQTAVATTGNAGNNYVVGDIITAIQGGASNGQLRVATVAAGAVTSLTTIIGQQGTAYTVANGLATTGGSGTGLEVNITALGETPLQAVQACRAANATWYPVMSTVAAAADHIAIASWTQSQIGTIYLGTDSEANVLNGVAANTFKTIYANACSRTWMQYATTQSGLLPNQVYFVAAVMGCFLAANSQKANSAFTMKFSAGVPLVGVSTEPLSTTQIANIEGAVPGLGPNGNLFLNYANSYNILEQGTMMAPSVYLDQIVGLDVLGANIQSAIMNLMVSVPKVPQTDAGQQLLIQAVESACAQAALVGFIAGGVWFGQTIPLSSTANMVAPGQALPLGFIVASPKYATLSLAQIIARQAPPIYVAIIESGAVHFVTIQVLVQV